MPTATDNQTLYDLGRQGTHFGSTRDERATIAAVAAATGEGSGEVRMAFSFARSVDAIEAAVPGSRTAILGDHPHLTPAVVVKLSRWQVGRLREAMERAAGALHPRPPPPPAVEPYLVPWHHDLTRLREAFGLLSRAEAARARPGCSLRPDEISDLALHAAAVRVYAAALRQVVDPTRCHSAAAAPQTSMAGAWAGTVGLLRKARGLVEAVTGDLLRAAHSRPLGDARVLLAGSVADVSGATERIAGSLPGLPAVTPPTIVNASGGPNAIGGTYVIIYHTPAARVVRLGGLGTFWLPAGYLLYVGSAFQRGGVAARTEHHLRGVGPRRWNADYLSGFARPVERWWTHHLVKLECTWALALATARGYSCPAPRAGANDCGRCPAHLYHTLTRPTCASFARSLGEAGSDGYTVSHQAVARPSTLDPAGTVPRPIQDAY